LAILAVLYAIAFGSSFQVVSYVGSRRQQQARLRDLAIIGATQPLLRLGAITWRRVERRNYPAAIVMLRFFFTGDPLVRTLLAVPARKAGEPFGQYTARWMRWFAGIMRGLSLEQIGGLLFNRSQR